MSTLELEHIKHSSSSGNNLSVHSDGSLTLGSLNGNIHVGTMGVGHTASPTSYGDGNTMFSIHKNTTNGSVNALIGTDTVKGGMYVNNTGSDNEIKFGTVSNYPTKVMSNGVTGVEVNGSGHVTKPNTPFFEVHTVPNSYAAGQVTDFTGIASNVGNHWDNTTNRFTAPVSGIYQFNFSVFTHRTTSTGDYYWDLRKNTVVILRAYDAKDAAQNRHGQIMASHAMHLNVNDYVDLYFAVGISGMEASGNHNRFSGYLVG